MPLIRFGEFSYGKTVVFPGGYGRIGEILHGPLRLDWGLLGFIQSYSN